jgi:hypothetical protein
MLLKASINGHYKTKTNGEARFLDEFCLRPQRNLIRHRNSLKKEEIISSRDPKAKQTLEKETYISPSSLQTMVKEQRTVRQRP